MMAYHYSDCTCSDCKKPERENKQKIAEHERRELFQKVALAMLPFVKSTDDAEMFSKTVTVTTEAILTAAQKFAEQQPRKSEGET